MQEAGTSRAGGVTHIPHGDTNVEQSTTPSKTGRPPNPQARTARTSQLIVLKDGDPIPEGYAYVTEARAELAPPVRTPQRPTRDTVDLTTPPKATDPCTGPGTDTAKARTAARRNLTKNTNIKANATFARDLKESLATGQPMTLCIAEGQNDLKSAWHAAAKEVAYKFLDLRKESWKEYTIFEKNTVHNEVNEQYKYNPPIDPKRIDKYLSGHLRTSRAVWKAHWKRHGPTQRHHNCPEAAWEKLVKWWPTDACQEESVEMASRRARVERNNKVGRSSLMERMDEQVSNIMVFFFMCIRFQVHSPVGVTQCAGCIRAQYVHESDLIRTVHARHVAAGRMVVACAAAIHTECVHGYVSVNPETCWQGCMSPLGV